MKKNIMFVGVSICLLILLGIGLSYSMWNMRVSQDTDNVISTTDCFDITLANQSNAIKLDNAYPITDAKGKTLTPFTFSIKNVCDMAVAYTVSLESLKGTTLASDYLKVMVNNNEPQLLNGLTTTDVVNTTSIESRVLDTGTLFKNNTKEYSIRLWIDYNTTLDDLNNETKVLKSKIIIKGVPSNEKGPVLLTDQITTLAGTDTTNFATDDADKNVRYIGKDPSNYVYFNCSDYSNPSADTCELWRIIGVFNNVTKSDGSKENLVKIIRADSLGDYSWDYKGKGVGTSYSDKGSNDWSDSQLMMMLNPTNYLKSGYINSSDIISSGSQQLYSKMGSYYNGTKGCKPTEVASGASFSCTEVDFTSTGLKNDTTRNAIEEVVWNLGGSSTDSDVTSSMFYERERGTTVYTGRPTTWTGKIGLMYPSDYGYATSGGTTKDRAACLATELYSWGSSDFSDCKGNDYLLDANNYQCTLAPNSAYASYVFYVSNGGFVGHHVAYFTNAVRPALFLKSNIQVDKGTGEKNDPYHLSFNSKSNNSDGIQNKIKLNENTKVELVQDTFVLDGNPHVPVLKKVTTEDGLDVPISDFEDTTCSLSDVGSVACEWVTKESSNFYGSIYSTIKVVAPTPITPPTPDITN